MGQIGLTLWFAFTTLLGPGVCCCSFSLPSVPTVAASEAAKPASPSKSRKACCHEQSAPCGEEQSQNSPPGKPDKCPCQQDTQVKSVPPNGPTHADLATQLKLDDNQFVLRVVFATPDYTRVAIPQIVMPSGRVLLAVYSILRC
jgi:hypothetical protein